VAGQANHVVRTDRLHEDAPHFLSQIRGDECLEPVAIEYLFFLPSGQAQKVFVGEDDARLAVKAQADLRSMDEHISPFRFALAKYLFGPLAFGDVLPDAIKDSLAF